MSTQDTQSHDFNELEPGKTTKITADKPKKNLHKKLEDIKDLEKLAFENLKTKYPSVPFLPKPKYKASTKNGLTKCVIDYIRLTGGIAEKVNSNGYMKDNRKSVTDILGRTRSIGSTKWIPGINKNAIGDIHCIINGKSIRIEIKCAATKDSTESEEQILNQKKIETAGSSLVTVTSFSDFLKLHNEL